MEALFDEDEAAPSVAAAGSQHVAAPVLHGGDEDEVSSCELCFIEVKDRQQLDLCRMHPHVATLIAGFECDRHLQAPMDMIRLRPKMYS
jgi:hypothetical protein